jgi:hypothetical protein
MVDSVERKHRKFVITAEVAYWIRFVGFPEVASWICSDVTWSLSKNIF